MRGLAWLVALSAIVVLASGSDAWARGCKGGRCGRSKCHSKSGCSSSCGSSCGSCKTGTCSTSTCSGGVCTASTGGSGAATAALEAPVTLVVALPADANLTIDGNPTVSTSSLRTFVSPALKAGKDYTYTLKAEIVRDGQPLSVTQQVQVRAGEETRVSINIPTNAVASR